MKVCQTRKSFFSMISREKLLIHQMNVPCMNKIGLSSTRFICWNFLCALRYEETADHCYHSTTATEQGYLECFINVTHGEIFSSN